MGWLTSPEGWIAFITLTALEIVLGIDNIIFISILTSRLPAGQQARARRLGLGAAMVMRVLLLLSLSWMMRLTTPLFHLVRDISGRDLILIIGGLFLLYKATHEIHERVEGEAEAANGADKKPVSFQKTILTIMVLDLVFSLDSVITAVGMANDLSIMISAVVIAVGVMLLAAGPVSSFVERHPTVKMLALAFLLMIGLALVADGLAFHIPKGYIYFAMGFSVLVEALNLRAAKRNRLKAAERVSAAILDD